MNPQIRVRPSGEIMPDAGVLATILLIVGLFLLALELMVPSFGMLGIMSAITLLISAWCAWQAWWGTSPGFFWTYAAFWLLGIPSAIGGTLFVLQNTRLGDRLVLRGPAATNKSVERPVNPLEALIGEVGVSDSLLTPGGMVRVGNERHHAESPGMVIESGTPIKVVAVRANRLVVKIHNEAEHVAEVSAAADVAKPSDPRDLADTVAAADIVNSAVRADGESTGILDFDIPED